MTQRCVKIWCLCLASIALLDLHPAEGAVPSVKMKSVVVPIYAHGQSNAAARLKIGRLFRENRRIGFFRVKLMPTLVAESVQLEFRSPTPDADVLGQVHGALVRLADQSAFELRGVTFSFPGETAPRLVASLIRSVSRVGRAAGADVAPVPALAMEGVTVRSSGREWKLSKAQLRLEGPDAARVVSPAPATFSFHLFLQTIDTETVAPNSPVPP